MTPSQRLYIFDGHSLIFRMYYAFYSRPMVNGKGRDVSILFGFTKFLLEFCAKEHPDYLAVAFDPPCKTFRHKMFPEYKGTRKETPQLVIDALDPLVEICTSLNIPVLMCPGYEADDVICSAAVKFAGDGLDVYMVTPDKDYGQVIAPHIFQYKPGKGANPPEILGVKEICEKYGISTPAQVIDILTLMGDSADNIPGVQGVGEVGAGKFIGKYGSVDSIYEHIGELSAKQQTMFEAARSHIGLSRDLVTIKTDVPFGVELEEMVWTGDGFSGRIAELFSEYEFNSLKKYINGRFSGKLPAGGTLPESPEISKDVTYKAVAWNVLSDAALLSGKCAVSATDEESDIFSPVASLAVAVRTPEGIIACRMSPSEAAPLLEDENIAKYGISLKSLAGRLCLQGVALKGYFGDCTVMHYLINPETSHSADTLCREYLSMQWEQSSPEGEASVELSLFDEPSSEPSGTDYLRRAALILELGAAIEESMEKAFPQCGPLYRDIEEPLIRVLSDMETAGVRVDMQPVAEYAALLREDVLRLQGEILDLAGDPSLNIKSPKQVGELLFDKLKLDPKAKKSTHKGTYSTDEETLLEIRDAHPIVDKILEYRALTKLLSTYIEPFGQYVNPRTGKIHTTFNQDVTATGRLSSSKPNLQNIPIRTERGRELRKAFISSMPDGVIISADYSQIELRLMAHFCQDANLLEAFAEGVDVHSATAARIYGIPVSEVTPEQRRVAKTANFGIMYGISAFGLAQRLRISRREAQQIIDDYFTSFPSIKAYIDNTIAQVGTTGYAVTLLGRRRFLPAIFSTNGNLRAFAQRNAVNAPIQGTAADIIKLAMVRVDARMKKAGLRSRMVLQIHDELLFDAVPDEVEGLCRIIKEEMEHVLPQLDVPLTVECNYGKNWLQAH
ncbi:MAG: DNA polymerase I [Bacteroidales bacterium]|nr:DNA polymerase I [Bacteroidales bacterium]